MVSDPRVFFAADRTLLAWHPAPTAQDLSPAEAFCCACPSLLATLPEAEYVTSCSETNAAGRPFFAFFPASIKEAYMRGARISASPAQVRI